MDLSESLAHFEERGYVVLQQAIDSPQVDDFWEEVERNIGGNEELTLAIYGEVLKNREVGGVFSGTSRCFASSISRTTPPNRTT